MKTKAIWSHKRNLMLSGLLLAMAACGGGGGSIQVLSPATGIPNDTPTGLWVGIDSNGEEVVVLVADNHEFRLIDELLSQGSGILVVSFGNNVFSGNDFRLVTRLGLTFPDGTTSADCSLSGTVTERQTMSVTVDCTTTAGLQDLTTVTLNYDTLYERDSSLTAIAGNYDNGAGSVLNVAEDGSIFEQDAGTGCVTNGQINIIDSAFNAYSVEFGISNCIGQDAVFNGSSFSGLATLDNTIAPEQLMLAVTGDVAGTTVSIVDFSARL